jgi:energy-coupling factor transporter ATP-binding protein EcfA2
MNSSDKLTEVYNAFEPLIPADDPYYEDCREARGGDAIVRKIIQRLIKSKGQSLRFLFTGHLGCGKSSELKHLSKIIKKETTVFPVYIDFDDYLDRQDVDLEDIFLGIITEISTQCKEIEVKSGAKVAITPKQSSYSLLKSVGEFFAGFSVKGEVGLPFDLAKINVEKLKQNPSLRKDIRQAVKGNSKRTLLSELNDLILDLEVQLLGHTEFTKLVVIADSLEHIRKFEDADEGVASQKRFFIDKKEELDIACHVIYTVPLELCYSSYGTELPEKFGKDVFMLPMVKTHKRGNFDENYEAGWRALKNVINKRLKPIGITIEQTFEAEALAHLIKYSGGNIRYLIRFIQEASISVDNLPIDFRAARLSVKETVNSFARTVREEYWTMLAKLELSKNQQIENGNDDYAVMLRNLSVLEYINGSEDDDENDVWFAVNPSIRRTVKFQEALENLKSQ